MQTHETITTNNHTFELEYTDHFASDQFIRHVLNKYDNGDKKDLVYLFSARMLETVIQYGIEHNNVSLNQLAYFLYDIIPEMEYSEVVAYCENDILSQNARLEKYDYWDRRDREGGGVV